MTATVAPPMRPLIPRRPTPSLEHADSSWMPPRRSPVRLAQAPTALGLPLACAVRSGAETKAAPAVRCTPLSGARDARLGAMSEPTPVIPLTPARRDRPAKGDGERRVRPLIFEYSGHGSISIMSSITGRHYRFSVHGQQVEVDARDGAQLARVPELRQI